MYTLIRWLPLQGARVSGLAGKHIGRQGSARFTTGGLAITFGICRIARYEVARSGNVVKRDRSPWIRSGEYEVTWTLRFDTLTVVMCIVVTRVSTIVHRYSTEYMSADPHLPRFIAYLSRFTFGMLRLVTAENRVQRFVGWEAVGVCSYLLINFWFTRIQANKAARKAMIVNRVGDVGLARGLRRIYRKYGALDYGTIYSRACSDGHSGERYRVGVGLRIGAIGKSAQLGLHTWLPDAMEGPTPVSALIHAATIVTAGVYRIARCSPMLEYESDVLKRVTLLGGATAVYAGTVGLVQNDLKRVIAYSTCSQLGYIRIACGLSSYDVAVFHLANHALFKGLLFLSAGAVIHGIGDEQDIRRYGGRGNRIPLSYAIIRIGSVSLIGFPYLTGYYSKDVIREAAYGTYQWTGHLGHTRGLLAAFGTGAYSLRLRQRTFLSPVSGYRKSMEHAHDAPRTIARPIRVLCVGGIWGGWLGKDAMIGRGTSFWGQAIYVHPEGVALLEGEFRETSTKRAPVRVGLIGGTCARRRRTYGKGRLYNRKSSPRGRSVYTILSRKWYFDKVYTERLALPTLKVGHHYTYIRVDRGLIERRGPSGRTQRRYLQGNRWNRRQSGDRVEYLGYRVYGYRGLRALAMRLS